jgi:hypothetical protein
MNGGEMTVGPLVGREREFDALDGLIGASEAVGCCVESRGSGSSPRLAAASQHAREQGSRV